MAEHAPAGQAHGETVAGTEAHGGGHAAEPTVLGVGPAWFVSAAMVAVFAIIIWKKIPAAIGRALDKQIESIRARLDEAAKLRAEAEALRAEYEAKSAAADAERKEVLKRAKAEARAIVEQAKTDTAALIERRARMAEDKIAAAERQAIDEVRAKAASAAAAAAAKLIAEELGPEADKAMVDRTIAELKA
jgi:F-type H+-transporting ATPase subunit b